MLQSAENQSKTNSWIVLPAYLDYTVRWYLDPNSEFVPVDTSKTLSFPPIPDVLIITRRHHIIDPDGLIEKYRLLAGEVKTITSIPGFELYVRQNPQSPPPGAASGANSNK